MMHDAKPEQRRHRKCITKIFPKNCNFLGVCSRLLFGVPNEF